MTTDNEELFECVIPLPDALIRKPMDEQVKSVKHGDHDQSDHGNWATGGSAGAGETKDNPIRTSDVEEAARALGEGKHVQLSSPDQVATLLDRLNELAKEAEAAGSKAKNIDLCNVTVPGTNLFCVESKGIPRVEMPQLKGIPNAGSAASDLEADKRGEVDITEAYLEQLRSSGVTLDEDDALASHLKATQNELNGNKVAGIMSAARAGELDLNQPIVVSRDGYIVDGHHRWAAKVALEHDGIDDPETDMKIPVVRVDQDILDILESSKQFAADMGLPQVAVKSIKHADHDQSEHGNWATGNTEKTGPEAWLGIAKLSDVPKYKIGSSSEASEPQVAARIAENIAEFKAAGGVVTRLPILPNAGVTGPYSYAETPEQEATSTWLFREAESARASADEYELRAEAASSQEEQDKLLSIASGYSHMATALDRASGSGTFIATTGGERGTIVGVLAGSFNSVEWEGTMFGSSQSVAGTGSALMYAAIEAVADADRVTRVGITFPEPESLPFYRAFGFTPEAGTWESKPNPASVILSRGSAVRIDQAVSGMTPESIVAQYGLTKSVKHGDHDQLDHGNWAHGNAAVPELDKSDKKEAEKYLEERYPPDDPNRDSDLGKKLGLTSLEWAAADHYRTQGYMEINNLLRGKGSDWGMEYAPADIRSVQLLDEAMDKSTVKNFETVYRGTSMLASKMDTFLSGLEVGGVYTDPSFTSTSRSEDIAESFATNRHPDTEKEERANVMWEIVLPPGTSALDMQSLFPNFGSNEEEVLLDRDTHLRILSKESAGVSLDGEPVYRVKAIAIPTTTKSVKHGDHDQSDHGNWATGGGETRSKASRQLFAKDEPEAYINKNERDALAREWSTKLSRHITELDVLSLDNYKRWGSVEINGYLRGQSEPSSDRLGFVQDRIDGIKNLAKPLDRDTVVYRWVPSNTSTGDPISDMLQKAYEDGKTVTDSGFMSTSTEVTGGRAWGKNLIAIEVPAGTPVVDFNDWTPTLNGEKEILLMPDTALMLTYSQTLEDGSQRFVASVVESGAKSLKHADHDQSDHGNWADGSVPLAKTPIEQVDSLRQWSSNSYDQVNKALRDPNLLAAQERGGTRDLWQKTQDGLDRLFKGVPLTTRPWTLYRGATGEFVTDIVKQYDSMIAKMQEEYRATGKPPTSFVLPRFTDKGFVSTTPDKDVAMHFTGSGFQGGPFYTGDGRAMFEINLPEGSKMVNVEEYANEFGGFANYAAEESEFLLPRGLTFEVTDVTPSEDQFGSQGPVFYTIKLDVVSSSTKSVKHADHDQSDHGSWADGSAETRSAAKKALTHYSIDGYHRINSYLRKIDSSQDELNTGDFDPEPVIKEIDYLFNSATPLKEPVTVFRGLDSEVAESITWTKGDIYTDSAFMSTSLSEAVSERFTGYGGTGSYMMQIEVPAGTTALTPSMFDSLVDEEEVILNRGTTLQITGTEFKDNFNYIYATVVAATKSLKHADHDQDDHGNWARGASGITPPTEDQFKSVLSYTEGSGFINSRLRAGYDPEDISPRVKDLDDLIASQPLKEDTVVYRGGKWSMLHFDPNVSVGQRLTDEAFLSTTTDGGYARTFITQAFSPKPVTEGDKETNIMMEILLPKGFTALDIDATMESYGKQNYKSEHEILLPRGAVLEVTAVEVRPLFPMDSSQKQTVTHITATVVPSTAAKSLKHADHDQSDHGSWADKRDQIEKEDAERAKNDPWKDSPISRSDAYASMAHYAHDGYYPINRFLRGSDGDRPNHGKDRILQDVKNIDALFAAATPLAEDLKVFRGVSYEQGKTMLAGSIYTDAGYTSTSRNSITPFGFMDATQGREYMMEITVPAGSKVVQVELTNEAENLLPRDSQFKITGLRTDAGITIVEATLINSVKSVKHGDHDQSDHGNWARGGSASPTMTQRQYDTVHEYTRNGYRNLNETLREGDLEEVEYELESERVKDLDALIAANSLTKDTVVYRGVKLNDDQRWAYGDYTDWNYVNSGDILRDEGYMSTAKSYSEAAKFMSFGQHSGQPIMFAITVPAGSPALDVSAAMKDYESKNGSSLFYPYESEILLPRQTRLEITDKSTDENGRLVISATVSPLPTKSLKHGDHDQEDHGNWARGSEFRSPSSEDRYRTPKGSATSTPYAAHYYDTQQRQRIDMALDAYTHWKPENSGDTDADRPFHEVLNENLRNGMNRGKAVEAASAEFATGDEKDDEATASDLYEGFMNLDSATQNSRMMEDTVVTRASSPIIYLDELEAAAAGGSLELYGFDISQGAVFSDAGFVSTSLDTTGQSTQYFASRWDTEGLDDNQIPTSVRWNITVPEGAPALDLRALEFASQHGEQEVILPRNTHFQVDSWDVQLPKFEGSPASVTINATVIPTHSTTKP